MTWDAALNEYQFIRFRHAFTFYFCPSCGGRLPPSRRGDLFTELDSGELDQIRRRIARVRTIADAVAALGEPDERHGPQLCTDVEKKVYGMRDEAQVLVYRRLASSIVVHVTEYVDGGLGFSFSGQRK
ncbi:MAG: hypothetical protein AB1716_15505 [Planctomycetota bacterium]